MINGHGLYYYDTVSSVAQMQANDLITLVVGLPLFNSDLPVDGNDCTLDGCNKLTGACVFDTGPVIGTACR